MSGHEMHEQNINAIWRLFRGAPPDDRDERARLLCLLIGVHAGALTPVSEDEKRGMERVLAILERKIGDGGGVAGGPEAEQLRHNRFYAGRWSAFRECAMMLQSALRADCRLRW
ncbi:hypothetical protein RA307_31745 [Xanthobacteraceae bacterium Astr-EGSB]|uniref:hypothetical protein n=1 Tax=Astrobacterium formosum TaxID=3069710 RepID=UPI0027B5743A|nr:hypothetical protein [Xanthobacteraceae bacterium Astr-EGSB]